MSSSRPTQRVLGEKLSNSPEQLFLVSYLNSLPDYFNRFDIEDIIYEFKNSNPWVIAAVNLQLFEELEMAALFLVKFMNQHTGNALDKDIKYGDISVLAAQQIQLIAKMNETQTIIYFINAEDQFCQFHLVNKYINLPNFCKQFASTKPEDFEKFYSKVTAAYQTFHATITAIKKLKTPQLEKLKNETDNNVVRQHLNFLSEYLASENLRTPYFDIDYMEKIKKEIIAQTKPNKNGAINFLLEMRIAQIAVYTFFEATFDRCLSKNFSTQISNDFLKMLNSNLKGFSKAIQAGKKIDKECDDVIEKFVNMAKINDIMAVLENMSNSDLSKKAVIDFGIKFKIIIGLLTYQIARLKSDKPPQLMLSLQKPAAFPRCNIPSDRNVHAELLPDNKKQEPASSDDTDDSESEPDESSNDKKNPAREERFLMYEMPQSLIEAREAEARKISIRNLKNQFEVLAKDIPLLQKTYNNLHKETLTKNSPDLLLRVETIGAEIIANLVNPLGELDNSLHQNAAPADDEIQTWKAKLTEIHFAYTNLQSRTQTVTKKVNNETVKYLKEKKSEKKTPILSPVDQTILRRNKSEPLKSNTRDEVPQTRRETSGEEPPKKTAATITVVHSVISQTQFEKIIEYQAAIKKILQDEPCDARTLSINYYTLLYNLYHCFHEILPDKNTDILLNMAEKSSVYNLNTRIEMSELIYAVKKEAVFTRRGYAELRQSALNQLFLFTYQDKDCKDKKINHEEILNNYIAIIRNILTPLFAKKLWEFDSKDFAEFCLSVVQALNFLTCLCAVMGSKQKTKNPEREKFLQFCQSDMTQLEPAKFVILLFDEVKAIPAPPALPELNTAQRSYCSQFGIFADTRLIEKPIKELLEPSTQNVNTHSP